MKLPEAFNVRMAELLGDEYPKFLESYDEPHYLGLRANSLKISACELKSILPAKPLEPVSWCDEGFYYNEAFRAGKSPYYHAGLYYIQEPSAMAPAALLDVSPGHKVLDICAAPGGKTTALAAKLNRQGLLVANDISASRLKALLKNIEVAGVTNSVITNEPPERLSARFGGFFDRILVDAPCSGEGMFRKDPDAVKSWEAHKSQACCVLQRSILFYAAQMLKPGGRIMYSTCTFAPEENELMIAEFLEKNSDFALIPIEHEKYGFERGLCGLPECARLWPHKLRGEGHFLAYLQKTGASGDAAQILARTNGGKIKGMDLFREFCEKYLNIMPDGDFELHGQSLFLMPDGLPSLNGIRLMRSGFYLGDILNKRFEPSQAFAMGLRADDVKYVISFEHDDERLYRYLKGESFDIAAEDGVANGVANGWNLVCVGKYPLGWCKVQDGRLKNKYLKSWLMN